MAMNHQPNKKDKETEDLVAAFLKKGGKITKLKTKEMAPELGISNSSWNQKLTKAEKDAKNGN
jgi:hypothetical protein